MNVKGIDVSTFQRIIDWSAVKADGVEFAMIRAGYGQNNIDAQFVRNISECNRVGMPCGVYWFSYARSVDDVRREAEYCLQAISPYELQYPVAFDFEYDSVKKAGEAGIVVTKKLATSFVHAFCSDIEAAGYYVMNYTNSDFLRKYFDETTLKYDLWKAAWNTDFEHPPECGIWQWGGTNVKGITTGKVDSNIAYKDYPAIIKSAGLGSGEDKVDKAIKRIRAVGGDNLLIELSKLL